MHLTSDLIGLVHKLVPAFVKGFLVVTFILVHNVREVDFQEFVHFIYWSDLVSKIGLLLADLLKGAHNATERVNVDCGFVNLKLNLLELVHKVLKHGLGFLVEVFRESELPFLNPFAQGDLDLIGLKGKGTDLVVLLNGINFLHVGLEATKLSLVIFKLGIFSVECLKLLIHVLFPEPLEFLKALLESNNDLSGSLNRTSQE